MAHPDAELIARAYDAFGRGDIPAVLDVFAPDITWHVPGRSPISGDYKGHDEVLGHFAKFMELCGGTLRLDVDEVACDGGRVYVYCTVSAERYGQAWSSPEIHVWRVVAGRAVEFREFQGDQQTEDEFWSYMTDLDVKKALVTGAASGLGKANATEFVESGARVSDMDEEGVEKVAADLGASSVRCDVTDALQGERAVDFDRIVAANLKGFGWGPGTALR